VKFDISVPGRWCLAAAAATWVGVGAALIEPMVGGALAFVSLLGAVLGKRTVLVVIAVFVVTGAVSGTVAGMRSDAIARAEVPTGRVELTARVAEESTLRTYGRAVIEPLSLDGVVWNGPRLATTGLDPGVPVGSTLRLIGDLRPRAMRVRDEMVAGVVDVRELISVSPPTNPIVLVGNAARGRVTSVYNGDASSDGLVRGLLIGDTDLLSARHEEDLRRAGLAHFIAVSGSNVAMFLVAWWFLTAPIAMRPVPRVIGGIIGLAIFAVITRWEPSVIRASVMSGALLVGGLAGIPLDPWMALGTAVTVLLLVSGHLAVSVGFQLSVAATVGVLMGVRAASGRRPRWLFLPLFVTMGAQIAVAPIILVVFGTIPLLAPLANLVVGPLVTLTTAIGAVALALPVLKPVASLGGTAILAVAGLASSGPQLGFLAAAAVVAAGTATVWRPTRPFGVAVVAIALMWASTTSAVWPSAPTLVVLDVGQGDAILLQDPSGLAVLIDGGASPRVLDRALRRNGVRRLRLVVADLDHIGGIIELLGDGGVTELWVPAYASPSGAMDEALWVATEAGVVVTEVKPGVSLELGSMTVEVLGPTRRYATENDGSVVLWITAGVSLLLPGDVETVAQQDLPPVRPDIMVVPHHGSDSTDLGWLSRTVGALAVLSYGENRFGHPHPDVLAVLDDAGVEVRHTYLEGDVVIDLSGTP